MASLHASWQKADKGTEFTLQRITVTRTVFAAGEDESSIVHVWLQDIARVGTCRPCCLLGRLSHVMLTMVCPPAPNLCAANSLARKTLPSQNLQHSRFCH